MLTLQELRDLAERLPDGAALSLPKSALLGALAGIGPTDATAASMADRTVAELAAHFHRSPSTIRGWLEAGRFPGAYKLSRRDWRVSVTAVEAFVAKERHPSADLSAWRTHKRLVSR